MTQQFAGLLLDFALGFGFRCCGPAFATSRMNRSKRGHASGCSSIFSISEPDFFAMSPDWSLQWLANNSPISAEKLHALGLVTFNWNRCEKSTFWLFSAIIGLPEEQCWAITHEMGDITTYETIAALMKIKNFHPTAVEAIGNAVEVHNICRQNRNQLTHFEVHAFGGTDAFGNKNLKLMRKSKRPDAMRPDHFSAELDDLHRVAAEIDRLDDQLWVLTVIMADYDPTKPAPWPAKLPVPALLWTPPPQSPAKQKRPPRPSRASRRKAASERKT